MHFDGNGGGGGEHGRRHRRAKTAASLSIRMALRAAASTFLFLSVVWMYSLVQIVSTSSVRDGSSSPKQSMGAVAAAEAAWSKVAEAEADGAAALRGKVEKQSRGAVAAAEAAWSKASEAEAEGAAALRGKVDQWSKRMWGKRDKSSRAPSNSSPLLVFACKRPQYLERTLSSVFRYHPAQRHLDHGDSGSNHQQRPTGRIVASPIIISQDGDDAAVRDVIEKYRTKFLSELGVPLYRMQHTPPDPSSLQSVSEKKDRSHKMQKWEIAYRLLAAHYGWALGRVFGASYNNNSGKPPHPKPPRRVIILEEDIEIGIDFFSFMNATADLLDSDQTLLAASAFNDNGKKDFVSDPRRLVRSDFFPGLGWMMSRNVWYGSDGHDVSSVSYPYEGLSNRWPNAFWDDWIREPHVRRGRHIIRPEISRTYHFGDKGGASKGQFLDNLQSIALNVEDVRWEDEDLSYLDEATFAEAYWIRVGAAQRASGVDRALELVAGEKPCDVRLTYRNLAQFDHFAEALGIMRDEKAGVPRTAYEGIVEVHKPGRGGGGCELYLTPPFVDRGTKPVNFGRKARSNLSKKDLLHELELL